MELNKNKFISIGKDVFFLNFDKLREICLKSSNDIGSKEIQIVQTYDMSDDEGMGLSQKIEHETKSFGGNQNGMLYEIIKLLIISILENTDSVEKFEPTFGLAFSINTLLKYEIIEKI